MSGESNTIKFTKPPVMERIAAVYSDLDPEIYQEKRNSWKDVVATEMPHEQPVTNFYFDLATKDGKVLPGNMRPKLKIFQRYWSRPLSERPNYCTQYRSDGFYMNLVNAAKEPKSYDELREHVERWLPRWCEHFDITTYQGVYLHYVNLIAIDTTPQFFANPNHANIDKALKVFTQFAGSDFPTLTHPYSTEANFRLEPPLTGKLSLRVSTIVAEPGEDGIAVKVEIIVRTAHKPKKLDLKAIEKELNQAHELILHQFQHIFTQEALESFR